MKKYSLKLFLLLLSCLLLSFCSDPVKVGENSATITLDAAWIDDLNDTDADGYSSQANIYFQVTTTKATDVTFVIKYKTAGASSYMTYKETAQYNISESSTWFVSLGSEGYELAEGCYNFSVEVYSSSELEASLTAEQEINIASFCMEDPLDDMLILTLNNTTFTIMDVSVVSYSSQNVNPGESAVFYFDHNPGNINILASTSGVTNTGVQIGRLIQWDFNHNLISNYETDLVINSSYFFMRMRNAGDQDFSPIYVNWGLTDQTMDNILIPNDNVNYNTGYYKANSNTEVRAYYNDESGTYIWWLPASLYSGENNQLVELFWEGGGLAKQGFTNNWQKTDNPELLSAPEFKLGQSQKRDYINPKYGFAQ